MKVGVTIAGILMTVLGVVLLARGVGGLASISGDCVDADCGTVDLTFSFGGGIALLTIGMIVWTAGANALRSGGSSGPLTWLGYFGVLGIGFFATGAAMLYTSAQPGEDNPGGVLTILGVIFGIVGIAVFLVEVFSHAADRNLARLRTTGLRGRGIVTGISDTGVTINMNPLVAFHMRIEVPGVQPYETTVRHQVNRLQVGSLRPGIVVPVLADPQHPSKITVDWDSPVDVSSAAGGGAPADSAGGAVVGSGDAGAQMDPEMLRRVSEALAGVAQRAESGQLPEGSVINIPAITIGPDGSVISGAPGSAGSAGSAGSGAGGATGGAGMAPTEAQAARVQIDSLRDMGVDLPAGRLYTFDLTVSIAGRAASQTRFASAVAPNLIPRLVKGASFPATVDPSGSGQLVGVSWDR